MNQTAGLFGGLLIAGVVLATAWYVNNGFSLTPASAAAATTTTPPGGGADMGNASSGSWGTTTPTPALTTQPYQLVANPYTGVGISTAAEIAPNEASMIPLPQLAPLAPTTSMLQYA